MRRKCQLAHRLLQCRESARCSSSGTPLSRALTFWLKVLMLRATCWSSDSISVNSDTPRWSW